ncbi:MAG: hypothetical protein MK085_09375 [Phycisphaerales bacterium]|nr:hypothetical protein [Phycisphaerales bacterium]
MPEDAHANSPEPSDCSSYGRNLTEARRQQALELVQHRIDELADLLKEPLPEAMVVRGSATCAEVRLADADSIQRFLQVVVTCPTGDLDAVETCLDAHGFAPGLPRNDTQVVRIAHQANRRPLFILLQDPNDALYGEAAPPPQSPEGRRLRDLRLQGSLRNASRVLARVLDTTGPFGTETETFEIHLVTEDLDGLPCE